MFENPPSSVIRHFSFLDHFTGLYPLLHCKSLQPYVGSMYTEKEKLKICPHIQNKWLCQDNEILAWSKYLVATSNTKKTPLPRQTLDIAAAAQSRHNRHHTCHNNQWKTLENVRPNIATSTPIWTSLLPYCLPGMDFMVCPSAGMSLAFGCYKNFSFYGRCRADRFVKFS